MGKADKAIRLIVAILLAVAVILEWIPKPWNYVAFAIASIFVITSFVNFCPLYAIFGASTCKKD